MNKRIIGLALPNIITNITVPLLGMVDMAIVGHLSSSHIAAITIGTSIFNLIYWNFGFLRMGTSGITAQAYGAGRIDQAVATLARSFALALAIAILLILLQWPISLLVPIIFEGSSEVLRMALTYFFIRIWAAPATLGLYAIKGWFIGMQNSRIPMWIAIVLNCVNIVASLLFVLYFKLDIAGVAIGTVVAQYSGLLLGLFFLHRELRRRDCLPLHISLSLFRFTEMKNFFRVNVDIFLRTVCLSAVFTFITAASGRISDQIMAIDALLLQFFTLFSYIMDGFAYAGESLVGRYIGARDARNLRLSVRLLLLWGLILTAIFTILYAVFHDLFLSIFTTDATLIAGASDFRLWIIVIPICGFAAFLLDGIFIGATASRTMRNAMFIATATFFAIFYGLRSIANTDATTANNVLWIAFMLFLIARGLVQGLRVKKDVYQQIA